MLADTLIRFVDPVSGQLATGRAPEEHQKLFVTTREHHLLGLPAAIAYWGAIGCVLRPEEFGAFMRDLVCRLDIRTLHSLAERLAQSLNTRAQQRPLRHPVGFQVAGYSAWDDDMLPRPTFLHVHNGDLHATLRVDGANRFAIAPTGNRNAADPQTREEGLRRGMAASYKDGLKVIGAYDYGPRGLFEVHHDFPSRNCLKKENLANLRDGYLTANGDHFQIVLRQEYEQLMARKGLRPMAARPGDPHYLQQRIEWMLGSARRIEDDKKSKGDYVTFAGPYRLVAFTERGVLQDRMV